MEMVHYNFRRCLQLWRISARDYSGRRIVNSMKIKPRFLLLFLAVLFTAPVLAAADAAPPATWHAQSLGQAIGYVLLFAAVGIAAAIAGYKLFDKCTPGDLNKEILENKNIAAAIIAGAVILGVSIIIAAAMMG